MRVFQKLSAVVFVVLTLNIVLEQGITLYSLSMFFFTGICSVFIFFKDKIENWNTQQYKTANCQVQTNGFHFPKGYYYKFGFLKNRKDLPFEKITEIRTNTYPPTAILGDSEVIFLGGLKKQDLIPLKENSNIKFTTPLDNWSLICDEFLDTEFTEEEQERTLERLSANGIPKEEVLQIRKRIRIRMLLLTMSTLEWVYYGQFDVLQQFWLNEKTYWWTMDIALRKGHNPSAQNNTGTTK